VGVVADGELVELGSHDELVGAGGHYTKLYETWVAGGGASAPKDDGDAAAISA
jgi:hypothetical protein